jgi:single-strand binding protein
LDIRRWRMNNVVIVGRLTKDPELRYITGSGTAVATFTLAIDRDYKNKDGSITTDFIPVEIMGKPAEFVANYITKGRLVGVQGSIRVDRYETPEGEKRTFTKVAGRNIQALESKNKATKSEEPPESPTEFAAVDDDDVPF